MTGIKSTKNVFLRSIRILSFTTVMVFLPSVSFAQVYIPGRVYLGHVLYAGGLYIVGGSADVTVSLGPAPSDPPGIIGPISPGTLYDLIVGGAGLPDEDYLPGTAKLTVPTGAVVDVTGTYAVGKDGQQGLTIIQGQFQADAISIGSTGSSSTHGEVIISNGGELKNLNGSFIIGEGDGTGILTLSQGGSIATGSQNQIQIGIGTGTGILNIGASADQAATLAGTISTADTVLDLQQNGILNFNHADLAYTFSNQMSGTGTINKLNAASITIFTSDSSVFSGTTNLTAGAMIVGDTASPMAKLGGAVHVQNGGILSGLGEFTGTVNNQGIIATFNALPQLANYGDDTTRSDITIATLNNAGTVLLAGNMIENQLIITNSLVGSGASEIILNTVIGDDSSSSDRIVLLNATASGKTSLVVQNAGGVGAQTNQGILLVDAQGSSTTTADAFLLGSASTGYRSTTGSLAIGAYDYNLVKGGIGGNAQSWYLVSSLRMRPEIGVYAANSDVAQTMFSMSLRDREGYVQRKADGSEAYSGWLRLYGSRSNWRTAHIIIGVSSKLAAAQLGVDLIRLEDAQYGSFYSGVMGGYGSASTKGRQRITGGLTSDGSVKGYSVGLYGTWYQDDKAQEKGAYIDAWLEYNWFDNTSNQHGGLRSISYDSNGVLASIEAGYGFRLSESATTWVNFEPQVQLFYSSLSTETHNNNGTIVRLHNEDGWAIRIGGRFNASHQRTDGMIIKPFLEANYWHTDWGLQLRLNNDRVNNLSVDDFAEVKAGFAMQHPSGWQPYGQISTRFDTNHYQSYGGQLGAKYHW